MNVLRWGMILASGVSIGVVIWTRVVNGVALLALIFAAVAVLTFPKVSAGLARMVVGDDPHPEPSRLDLLDGRGCCLVDHTDATACPDDYDAHEQARRDRGVLRRPVTDRTVRIVIGICILTGTAGGFFAPMILAYA